SSNVEAIAAISVYAPGPGAVTAMVEVARAMRVDKPSDETVGAILACCHNLVRDGDEQLTILTSLTLDTEQLTRQLDAAVVVVPVPGMHTEIGVEEAAMLGWKDDRPLAEVLPGKVAKALTKSFAYSTCGQLLLNHFPRDYIRQGENFRAFAERQAPEGSFITVSGTVTHIAKRPIRNGFVLNVTVDDAYTAVFFNGVWQERVLYPGIRVLFSGKLKFFHNTAQLQHP